MCCRQVTTTGRECPNTEDIDYFADLLQEIRSYNPNDAVFNHLSGARFERSTIPELSINGN